MWFPGQVTLYSSHLNTVAFREIIACAYRLMANQHKPCEQWHGLLQC